jgi:hypothetical protein
MLDSTIRRMIADARARARFKSDALGHRLGQVTRPPFVPAGPVERRERAHCERCPALVTIDVLPVYGTVSTGPALTEACTGVTRATVDGNTVSSTASRSDAYVRRWAAHWARQYPGRVVTIVYPTTGPLADWAPAEPGAARLARGGGGRTVLSAHTTGGQE